MKNFTIDVLLPIGIFIVFAIESIIILNIMVSMPILLGHHWTGIVALVFIAYVAIVFCYLLIKPIVKSWINQTKNINIGIAILFILVIIVVVLTHMTYQYFSH
jgi:hypothetical protein